MSEDGVSAEERRRRRREIARRKTRARRRIFLFGVPAALLAIIGLGVLVKVVTGGGGSVKESKEQARLRRLARQHAREERAIDKLLDYTTFIGHGEGKKREVALTFDDGPGASTKDILRILRRTKTPATFFVVGSNIAGNERLLRQMVREGHAVGDHTQNHPAMGSLEPNQQQDEIVQQETAMEKAGIKQRRLFRPPYRSFNELTFELLAERQALMVLWSVDTEDYANPDGKLIARKVLDEAKPGSIILMHDAGGDRVPTVHALPDIIAGLKKRNLKPVTVPRLVADDPPAPGEKFPEGL